MKIRLESNVGYTQAKGCYCIHIGTWAFMFGNKQGWRIELFTPLHLFRFSHTIPQKPVNNMGAVTKEEIEKFADKVLGCLYDLKGWRMEWTTASPSICIKERKIIFIEERYIGKYPWVAKENILHEIAHIFTDDKVHGTGFYKIYIKLLTDFMLYG